MFCPKCGKEIKDNQRFCMECGCNLSEYSKEKEEKSLYKKSYYKDNKQESILDKIKENTEFNKVVNTLLIILCAGILIFGFNLIKNNEMFSSIGLTQSRYNQYLEDPSSIPELTQPESLQDLVKNLKEVQDFLVLYLKYSEDSVEDKTKIFDSYRNQLLKIETFSNDNLLKEDVSNLIPRNKSEFNKCAKHYNKILAPVGFKVVSDATYGKFHLKEDYRFTYKKYGKYLPDDIRSYLYLRAKHNCEIIENGGYLATSTNKINKRIADFENYLNNNPDSKYIKEIQDTLYYYTFAYIFANDRTDMKAIRSRKFQRADKKFMRQNKYSKLNTIFGKMVSSANGISENQFNELYPYEYNKMLNAIRPLNNKLEDIFAPIRKAAMKNVMNVGYKYIYTSDGIFVPFSENSKISEDSLLLADNGQGFDVYNNKFKKQNQTIEIQNFEKVLLKRGQLLVYNPQSLQISKIEYSYGGFSRKVLSSKAIKQYFPDVLIINVDNIGSSQVQITQNSETQTYMLISHAGSDFTNYIMQADTSIRNGELSNIFTINTTTSVNFEWIPSTGDGKQYYINFISNQNQQQTQPQDDTQTEE